MAPCFRFFSGPFLLDAPESSRPIVAANNFWKTASANDTCDAARNLDTHVHETFTQNRKAKKGPIKNAEISKILWGKKTIREKNVKLCTPHWHAYFFSHLKEKYWERKNILSIGRKGVEWMTLHWKESRSIPFSIWGSLFGGQMEILKINQSINHSINAPIGYWETINQSIKWWRPSINQSINQSIVIRWLE